MRKTIAKAVTWRLIGTAEIFAISFWTTGHVVTAGHTAGIAAVTSFVMYVFHELAWDEVRGGIPRPRMKAKFAQLLDRVRPATLKGWTGFRIINEPGKSVAIDAGKPEELPPASTGDDCQRTRRALLADFGFVP